MSTSLNIKNIVITGKFEPSHFDKYYFISNGFFQPEEILPDSRFDSLVVQLISPHLQILILTDQIIFTQIKDLQEDDFLESAALRLVRTAKNQVFNAMGFNFHWYQLLNTEQNLEDFTKEHFYSAEIGIYNNEYFNNPSTLYGVYSSTNIKDARLKLDIKPNRVSSIIDPTTFSNNLIFAFNFHFDKKNPSDSAEFESYIQDYKYYSKACESIISNYEKR